MHACKSWLDVGHDTSIRFFFSCLCLKTKHDLLLPRGLFSTPSIKSVARASVHAGLHKISSRARVRSVSRCKRRMEAFVKSKLPDNPWAVARGGGGRQERRIAGVGGTPQKRHVCCNTKHEKHTKQFEPAGQLKNQQRPREPVTSLLAAGRYQKCCLTFSYLLFPIALCPASGGGVLREDKRNGYLLRRDMYRNFNFVRTRNTFYFLRTTRAALSCSRPPIAPFLKRTRKQLISHVYISTAAPTHFQTPSHTNIG